MTESDSFRLLLARVVDGHALSASEAREAFALIMAGAVAEAPLAAFLVALRMRGETARELAAAAAIMREHAVKVDAPNDVIDTCGTGGDGLHTLNISTAAAFVLAGGGVTVAKHGNRSVSSRSGSSDVLAALGVTLDVTPEIVARALRDARIGFLFAPRHHGAMRHVAPVRAQLGLRTIFNLLGPLANPAGPKRQLLGVYDRRWLEPMAEALDALGCERAWVVHGAGGLDEIALAGPTDVAELKDGGIHRFTIEPRDAGLGGAPLDAIKGGDGAHNAAALRRVLAGESGPYRDILMLNAGAGFVIAGKAATLRDGAALAAAAIDSGAALGALERLVAITGSAT